MITTTAAYKTAIKEPARNIKPKLEIYFDGESSPATELDSSNIAGIDFLNETQADGGTPLGVVSSDEILLTLRNDENQFLAGNASGPYYGKLLPNIKIIPYYGLQLADETFEWLSLGEYWTTDWDVNSGDAFATVNCQDRLFKLGEKDIPLIPTAEDSTRYQVWETLFNAIGLTASDYDIEASLANDTVPIVYYSKGKVRNAMTELAEAFNCNATVGRNGKIIVTVNSTLSASVLTMQDTDLIYTSNMPQKFSNVYSEVKVQSNQPTVKTSQSILNVEGINIPSTGRTLDELAFSSAPSAFIEYIKIPKSTHLSINSISIGAQGITLNINNDVSAQKSVDVEIFGHPMGTIQDEVEVRDTPAYNKIGVKQLSIDNYLIQSNEEATIRATSILTLVSDESAYVELSTRGDFSLELNDVITAIDTTNKLSSTEVVPTRYNYNYNGGLSCDIISVKKSARE